MTHLLYLLRGWVNSVREIDGQRYRKMDRETESLTERQKDGQRDRKMDRETDRWTDLRTDWQTEQMNR